MIRFAESVLISPEASATSADNQDEGAHRARIGPNAGASCRKARSRLLCIGEIFSAEPLLGSRKSTAGPARDPS
jgi:hypothetical protein